MKFIVSSGTLLKSLQSISGIISTNTILPIAESFKFDIKENHLKVTATNIETTMSVELAIQSKEETSICIEAKVLMDLLKNLSEQPLTFDVNLTDYSVEFSSNEGKYSVAGENSDTFPKEPNAKGSSEFKMPSSRLLAGINNTIFAVSNDELRPAMSGVFFNMEADHITFVSTDAHRLVRHIATEVECPKPHGIIVPKRPLAQLKGILANDDSQVTIAYNDNYVFISNDAVKLSSRLIDAKFPDYKQVIPANNPYLLTVNRNEFLGALRRVGVFANKTTNQVILKINGNKLSLYAQDIDFSHEGNENMVCQYTGEDMDIAFNAKLFLELVNALTCEEINIELSTPSRAGILKPSDVVDGEDILMLIMPLMLNN
jgi:DNA polymerase III subunit beta